MTTNKIIDGLYFTIGMILFNPTTGESKTSDELNQDDRTTYDACTGAIELLRAQEPIIPHMIDWGIYECPICKTRVDKTYKFCKVCGKGMKWE